jgi:hypothetical protein
MPSLRSGTSLADTKRLRRPQTPRNPACSTTEDVFDAEHDGVVQTIVNQPDELTETGISDAESWQGLSNSEFEDLDHVLFRATSIANSCPEEEAAGQSTKAFQASTADDTEVQSTQELSTTTVPDSDEDLDAIAESLNFPSKKGPPDDAEIHVMQDLGMEPKNRDLAQNCDAADAMDITLDSVVPPTRPDLPRDQPPNREKNADVSLYSHRKHSPTCQTTDPRRKQAMSDHMSTTVPQGGKPKKPDLAEASPTKRVKQGKLCYIEERALC